LDRTLFLISNLLSLLLIDRFPMLVVIIIYFKDHAIKNDISGFILTACKLLKY
jgi:hypothetical protein